MILVFLQRTLADFQIHKEVNFTIGLAFENIAIMVLELKIV